MNPTPAPNINDKDETAISSPAQTPASATSEATDAGAPTDVTIVRVAPSAPTVSELPAPNSFGKYELLGELARGGMGVVHRARQPGLDRVVALKMILGTGISHESAQRFLQEARAAAALDHPNVVPIYDIGEIGDRPYFTMALIDGPNLRAHLDALGTAPIATVVALFAQIVAGVAHAHQHGIIHRDLKPANVLIDKDGRPRVTDFGLAKRTATDSALTTTGQVVGTPQYMAPEQARDSKDVGPPADVYALGAILYFLLTGRPPFAGESFTDLLIKVVQDAPVPPGQLRPDVPPELEALCLRCLAKRPEERFADATALGEALAPIADQLLTPSASLTPSLGRIGSRPSTPVVGTVPDLTPTTNSGPAFASAPSVSAAAPTASAPAPNRPMIFGLAAVAVLLVGAIAFLATRDKKKDEVAKQDPPPAAGTPGSGQPAVVSGPSIAKGPEIVTPGGTNDGNKKEWAPPGRPDFGLKVDLHDEKKDAAGVYQLTVRKPLTLRLTAEKECRVFVWLVEPSGNTVQLFPNSDDRDNRLVAGKERVVPGNESYVLETTLTEGAGTDRLRVFAYTGGKPPSLPRGKTQGRHEIFVATEGKQLAAAVSDFVTTRGVVIKKVDPGTPNPPDNTPSQVAEEEIRFRVPK
jgi:eukaryotic-like serine/threonine-protein kinase